MQVSINEIRQKFDDLIEEKVSREQISDWAIILETANDENYLEFIPFNEKKRIWRSIIYLTGVDLKDIDGEYLHSIENFMDFRKKIGI